nr:hypothetical protein Iba_chr09aCG7140 [Ipomoea batatas]
MKQQIAVSLKKQIQFTKIDLRFHGDMTVPRLRILLDRLTGVVITFLASPSLPPPSSFHMRIQRELLTSPITSSPRSSTPSDLVWLSSTDESLTEREKYEASNDDDETFAIDSLFPSTSSSSTCAISTFGITAVSISALNSKAFRDFQIFVIFTGIISLIKGFVLLQQAKTFIFHCTDSFKFVFERFLQKSEERVRGVVEGKKSGNEEYDRWVVD